MKLFILVIYALIVLIVPQLYTWALRSVVDEEKGAVVTIGGLLIVLIISGFTQALIDWDIIKITL